MSRIRVTALLLTLSVAATACAVRLGGPSPREYTAVAMSATAGATADQVASQVRGAGADIVLLAADRDSAWFADVASQAQLTLSGPGRTGPRAMGFLTSLEILGDTSIVLPVPEGGRIHMHDALYRVDSYRYIDLMMVRFDETPDIRSAVRTLFGYIATDVGADAAVLLAIDAPTQVAADSAAVLMRATYDSAFECVDGDQSAAASPTVQLVYGPSARLSCRSARVLTGAPAGIQARVVVNR
jgi:hypothetical protein